MNRTRCAVGGLRLVAVLVGALALLATSCSSGGSGLEYKDPDERAVFELPSDWHLYQSDELTSVEALPFVNPGDLPILSQVSFDGGPARGIANLSTSIAAADYPIGSYAVRTVSTEDRDLLSRDVLQNVVIPSSGYQLGSSLLSEDFDFGRDFEGIRRWVPFVDLTTSQTGLVYFISVTDPSDTTVFTMAAGCSEACWELYSDEIIGVVDSWIVNTRQ